jgi:hypothetical protein
MRAKAGFKHELGPELMNVQDESAIHLIPSKLKPFQSALKSAGTESVENHRCRTLESLVR